MGTSVKAIDPAENEFLASLEARSKHANLFFRVMANRPEVLKAFVPFYGAVMGPGSVDRRTKELVYLTCSYTNHCAFCTAAHIAAGKKAGITEQEMQSLQAAREQAGREPAGREAVARDAAQEQTSRDHDSQDRGFSDPELAAIRYARELTRTANAAATRNLLAPYFSEEQIVEITLVAATANWTNRFNNALGIFPDA